MGHHWVSPFRSFRQTQPHLISDLSATIMTTMTDVSGSWLGTYWQGGQPTRFEATLVQGGSVLDGRILDDSYLGEASVRGELIGHKVFFVKRYLTTSPSPIRYNGTLSEDGNYIHGHWRIGYFDSGAWEAYRNSDCLLADLAEIIASRMLTPEVLFT